MEKDINNISSEITLYIDDLELENKQFKNLGELIPEEYCFKIAKQLIHRDLDISSKEILAEIKRYFNDKSSEEYKIMDIVKYIVKLYDKSCK